MLAPTLAVSEAVGDFACRHLVELGTQRISRLLLGEYSLCLRPGSFLADRNQIGRLPRLILGYWLLLLRACSHLSGDADVFRSGRGAGFRAGQACRFRESCSRWRVRKCGSCFDAIRVLHEERFSRLSILTRHRSRWPRDIDVLDRPFLDWTDERLIHLGSLTLELLHLLAIGRSLLQSPVDRSDRPGCCVDKSKRHHCLHGSIDSRRDDLICRTLSGVGAVDREIRHLNQFFFSKLSAELLCCFSQPVL